jgi:hypothetical protein
LRVPGAGGGGGGRGLFVPHRAGAERALQAPHAHRGPLPSAVRGLLDDAQRSLGAHPTPRRDRELPSSPPRPGWNHAGKRGYPTATKTLRIVTLRVWHGATENGPLNDVQIPNFRGVRVVLGTSYNRVERNRWASRNGPVSDPPPEIPNATIRNSLIAVCLQVRGGTVARVWRQRLLVGGGRAGPHARGEWNKLIKETQLAQLACMRSRGRGQAPRGQ